MQSVRNQAQQHASAVIANLVLPENTALAATGSFARGEMTTKSDLDLVLLYDPNCDTDALFEQVEQLWYPIWDAKLRLDYSVRTPEECAAIVSEDPIAALSLLEITHVRGAPKLTEKTRELVVKAWRIQLKRDFSAIVDTAIARWRRSGSVVSMTKPDLKHGRGGLRDEELLKALALGNLCDAPDLSPQRRLLIDVRTMLHEHAGRARDVLDPEFAADIALGLGFTDRYELARAIAEASRTIDDALTTGLTVARNTLPKRKLLGFGRSIPRRPLDVDVVDAGGEIDLSRKPDLEDPALLLRVAAARARTGLPIADSVWSRLQVLPPMPDPWTNVAASDFFALLSSPEHTAATVIELDSHGLWSPLVPAWDHIRDLMPREPTHIRTIDRHSLQVVENCAERSVTVERPDLLYLAALFHDIGKGYGRPHATVGAEFVTDMAAKLRLTNQDTQVVTGLVRHHTLIPDLVKHRDIESREVIDELLDAVNYNLLIINLMEVLVRADSLGTGPGVWSPTMRLGTKMLCNQARAKLTASPPQPPVLEFHHDLALISGADSSATVFWSGDYLRESVRALALIAAKGWNIESASLIVTDKKVSAELKVYNTLGTGFDEAEFIQAYKSGVYSALPQVTPGAVATFWFGDIIEVRATDQQGALGALLGVLPEVCWLKMSTPGATMIVQCCLQSGFDRAKVERDVTRALANS